MDVDEDEDEKEREKDGEERRCEDEKSQRRGREEVLAVCALYEARRRRRAPLSSPLRLLALFASSRSSLILLVLRVDSP